MILSLVLILSIATVISILWLRGIDNAQKNYPEYKGEDLFDDKK